MSSSEFKRPQFGNRTLQDDEEVFHHNAWDDVVWTDEQKNLAEEAVKKNSEITLTQEEILNLENKQSQNWSDFYKVHTNRFFKDRHWLFTEFPELLVEGVDTTSIPEKVNDDTKFATDMKSLNLGKENMRIFEIGSGVGNTIYPILKYNSSKDIKVYASDFSDEAIEILKSSPEYDDKRCEAFVLDATADEWKVPFEENSIDIIVLIFVLSAINPEKFSMIIEKIYKYLKPGGLVLFRDYGRYDMAQLRFKKGKCVQDNFYTRGDGTLCYFFTQEELHDFFTSKGFIEEYNKVDRRLQVNRAKLLKMYRIWIQCKFRKPLN